MKPTLLILAAGMGSRYGSLKQMDGIGPNNEAILDYSVYDAIRAGFGKVVFVIRHSFEKEFKELFSAERFGGKIEVEYVFQELNCLPKGFTLAPERQKPWGTNHAVMMGAGAVTTPFAAINADDFYGAQAYQVMADYLVGLEGSSNNYCMVGYKLCNTLSEYGAVSRGECRVNEADNLVSVTERTHIQRMDGVVKYKDDNGTFVPISDQTIVSMNMVGFTPDYFTHSELYFKNFLSENSNNLTAEFYIPTMVNHLVSSGQCTMRVLSSNAEWFGVTYKEDRPQVMEKLNTLIERGVYPRNLWR